VDLEEGLERERELDLEEGLELGLGRELELRNTPIRTADLRAQFRIPPMAGRERTRGCRDVRPKILVPKERTRPASKTRASSRGRPRYRIRRLPSVSRAEGHAARVRPRGRVDTKFPRKGRVDTKFPRNDRADTRFPRNDRADTKFPRNDRADTREWARVCRSGEAFPTMVLGRDACIRSPVSVDSGKE
jgi:hypothetical protein